MKFCVQPPIRHPFALANFQLGRKGQRPKGRKVKRPNFQKLSEAFLIKSKVVPDVFMSIFKLKGPISRNFALELIVHSSKSRETRGSSSSQVSKHVCLSIPFIKEATQKGSSKEHCTCIKEKQNISSQSFSCNLTCFCTPFQYLWF